MAKYFTEAKSEKNRQKEIISRISQISGEFTDRKHMSYQSVSYLAAFKPVFGMQRRIDGRIEALMVRWITEWISLKLPAT